MSTPTLAVLPAKTSLAKGPAESAMPATPSAESPADSVTSTTVPLGASVGTAELIKELERKRVEIEERIKKLRAEAVGHLPAAITASSPAATVSSPVPIASSTAPVAASPTITPSSPAPVSSSSAFFPSTSSPKPIPSLASLQGLPFALKDLIGKGVSVPDLAHFREQGRDFRAVCTPRMLEARVSKLLPHVFNADPKRIAEFLATPGVQKEIVLTKSCYREGYFSKKLNQFICFRNWKQVSPLQAAALCLDNFLVRDLLSHIENNAVLRKQAAQQLQEVLNRKEDKPAIADVSATGTAFLDKATEKKVEKEADHCDEALALSADLDVYQAPFKALLKAYKDYLTEFDTLYEAENWNALTTLWSSVGECHKRLTIYGLQEFFGPVPFDPVPPFTVSPPRGECRYGSGTLLDLNVLGCDCFVGLCKGAGYCTMSVACGPGGFAQDDFAAISRLCELRKAELENIINCLLKPGVPITLTASDRGTVKP